MLPRHRNRARLRLPIPRDRYLTQAQTPRPHPTTLFPARRVNPRLTSKSRIWTALPAGEEDDAAADSTQARVIYSASAKSATVKISSRAGNCAAKHRTVSTTELESVLPGSAGPERHSILQLSAEWPRSSLRRTLCEGFTAENFPRPSAFAVSFSTHQVRLGIFSPRGSDYRCKNM